MLCFGIVGVAAGFGGVSGINNDDNSVTEDPVLCIGATCLYSVVDRLSPEIRQQVLKLFLSAGGDGAAGDWEPERGGVPTCGVP
ncbi:hypothetical protein CYMTET_32385 [Cymbomonas tetramitiformis]|uniref:Uncharacterized protein n=1 Tax=Cymbomonas tetramitiformis TaxID=36881 RepID=A0AAE0KS94_9CHLO|nr:hypothetical protein CYMTET_32385 [Cymbomonas tetramitiformis]